jgi:16S rRNA (uracil1498-N3)-methyltransferase
MAYPFFYEQFDHTEFIQLSEASIHHIMHVLRMKKGEQFWLTNGKGVKCRTLLTDVSKRDCAFEIVETIVEEKSSNNFHLAISFTKNPSRIEWMLEKTTEIGVSEITPLITKRSEKIFFKKERFEKILVSAMLQSQQTFLPIINEPIYFEEILKSTEAIKLIAHCLEDEKNAMRNELKDNQSAIILIGPEGDFTPEEINAATQNNFIPVSLGNKRLRTETAGLYACVVFNSL